jgi:hypothetical protein
MIVCMVVAQGVISDGGGGGGGVEMDGHVAAIGRIWHNVMAMIRTTAGMPSNYEPEAVNDGQGKSPLHLFGRPWPAHRMRATTVDRTPMRPPLHPAWRTYLPHLDKHVNPDEGAFLTLGMECHVGGRRLRARQVGLSLHAPPSPCWAHRPSTSTSTNALLPSRGPPG